MERIILTSRGKQYQIAAYSHSHGRDQIDADQLFEPDIKESDDHLRLLEETEGHETVIAVDIHRLRALIRVIEDGDGYEKRKQMVLYHTSEKQKIRI